MVHETEAGSLERSLAGLVGRMAVAAVAIAVVLLGLALLSELLRRQGRAHRLIGLLDATVPGGFRVAAASFVAIAATFFGTGPATAAESVRGWLGQPTTSTTRSVGVVTPDAIDELDQPGPPPSITGPVVLVPPATDDLPVEPAPSVPPNPVAPTPVAPPPSPELVTYVVQPGDCLWSIAAHHLAPDADGRTIDAGWRRIYDANRAAVGDNPSLIHPGLVLRLPPLDAQP